MRNGLSFEDAGRLGAYAKAKKTREDYLNNPSRCTFCSSALSYDKRTNKFCNSSCAASFNNSGVRRNGKKPKDCAFCGKKLDRSIKKYCNSQCMADHKWEVRKSHIVSVGKESSPRVAKRYLTETEGHRCSICNGTEWMGELIPLVLDHVDGDSTNNKLTNLRLVCGNCDMQLPTYKNKNKETEGRIEERDTLKERVIEQVPGSNPALAPRSET